MATVLPAGAEKGEGFFPVTWRKPRGLPLKRGDFQGCGLVSYPSEDAVKRGVGAAAPGGGVGWSSTSSNAGRG